MKPLNIEQLSYWERKTYFEDIDFLIIGAGIVGYSTALELQRKYPRSKITILERGILPSGASSKNAGFACFGSVTELLDDLSNFDEATVWQTVEKRWLGLQNLKSLIGEEFLELETNGSWDLILPSEKESVTFIHSKLGYLNEKIEKITGQKNIYSEDLTCSSKFGFSGIHTSYFNRLEGQINTGKMIDRFHQLAVNKGILCLFGIDIDTIESSSNDVDVHTSIGSIKANNVLVCTNGFARQFLPNKDVLPARAQVIVTSSIENLKVKGTFHYQQGYYYFRNVDNRILLGGGRNLDFEGETTTSMETTQKITEALTSMLQNVILPNQSFTIDYHWSGIMGVGQNKSPFIEKIDPRIGIGVRMGGMGVAIGSLVGKELAELF